MSRQRLDKLRDDLNNAEAQNERMQNILPSTVNNLQRKYEELVNAVNVAGKEENSVHKTKTILETEQNKLFKIETETQTTLSLFNNASSYLREYNEYIAPNPNNTGSNVRDTLETNTLLSLQGQIDNINLEGDL